MSLIIKIAKYIAIVLVGFISLLLLFLMITLSFGGFKSFSINGDYEYSIGQGYYISRCNTFHINLTRKNGEIPYFNEEIGIGPLYEYAFDDKYVYGRHYGQKKRNLFAGDEFKESDISKIFVVKLPINYKKTTEKGYELIDPQGEYLKILEWKQIP